jgi:Uma2 family endonuclease
LAEELGLEFSGLGSTTLKRLTAAGTEPDGCFYLHNWQRIIGKKRIDLESDPPPDLAIEIDVTNPSLDKLPIYADLGVAEIWRYTKNQVIFYRLVDDDYEIMEASELFSFLSPAVIEEALQTGLTVGSTTMRINFRHWVQAHKQ